MSNLLPIFVAEANAAKLLDLRSSEFRQLVEAGHLPKAREIIPGLKRWSVEDLRCIASGEAADEMGDVEW